MGWVARIVVGEKCVQNLVWKPEFKKPLLWEGDIREICGPEWFAVSIFCEHDSETFDFIKNKEYLDKSSNC